MWPLLTHASWLVARRVLYEGKSSPGDLVRFWHMSLALLIHAIHAAKRLMIPGTWLHSCTWGGGFCAWFHPLCDVPGSSWWEWEHSQVASCLAAPQCHSDQSQEGSSLLFTGHHWGHVGVLCSIPHGPRRRAFFSCPRLSCGLGLTKWAMSRKIMFRNQISALRELIPRDLPAWKCGLVDHHHHHLHYHYHYHSSLEFYTHFIGYQAKSWQDNSASLTPFKRIGCETLDKQRVVPRFGTMAVCPIEGLDRLSCLLPVRCLHKGGEVVGYHWIPQLNLALQCSMNHGHDFLAISV